MGTHMNESLFDSGETLPAVIYWADLPAGYLIVIDFFEDLPQFRFLACLRNDDGSFTLFVNVLSDGKRTFSSQVKLLGLPLDDVVIVGELERLGFDRGVRLLSTHRPRIAFL